MKRKLQLILALPLLLAANANAQTFTGPSSSQTPYLLPEAAGVKITSLLTVGDAVGGYKMAGIPDGLGAFDNNDGTFTSVSYTHLDVYKRQDIDWHCTMYRYGNCLELSR